jgi:hypothetical protein
MKQLLVLTLLVLTLSLVLAPTLTHDIFAKSSSKEKKLDSKAKKIIEKNIENYVKKHHNQYCLITGTTKKNNESHTLFDNACVPIIPPPPPPPTNLPPIAKITASQLIANVSDVIQLSASESSDPDGNIASYVWIGSGFSNYNETNTQFTFPNESKVTVQLIVLDNNGSKATATVDIVKWTPPTPGPEPTNVTSTKIDFTGDVSGTEVLNAIVKQEPDIAIVSGDLGYKSTLSWFKTEYGETLGEELRCVIGNHEAGNEDGSAALEKEALAFCGDHWYVKTANSTTLLIGFNSNGDAKSEIAFVKSITGDPEIMKGVKSVFLFSHKNGNVPPSSHHPAEVADIYKAVSDIPGVTVYQVNAHNHVMASAPSENWFISGAGGKSHYACGTGGVWTFCNNKVYGFLEFVINNSDGEVVANFYDTAGKVVNK